MAGAGPIVADLHAESDVLDALVADLPEQGWRTATPSPGWTIAHQIAHLWWTDQTSLQAVTDEAAFNEVLADAAKDPLGFVDAAAERMATTPPAQLLAGWRADRARLHESLLEVEDGRKLPWFGPPMSAASMATARLMETWAHGLDVADALGERREPTARLRSIAHIGVRTRDFAFSVHGMTPPTTPFHVKLQAPEGDWWTWGPEDAEQSVTGPAEDFCMLVTQRRAPADLAVTAGGTDAATWLTIAQAFAGPPGAGRG